jgi:hypothetical protein
VGRGFDGEGLSHLIGDGTLSATSYFFAV